VVTNMPENDRKPSLRFKGFNDAWEQCEAGGLVSITTGKSNTQDQKEDGIYPFFIRSETPVKSNKYLYDEEAVITIGDGQIGKVFHYINGKFDLHQRCYKMSNFTNLSGKYFYYYFSTMFYDRAMKMTAKATVDSVRLEMISKMEIKYPKDLKEQNQISLLLSNVDSLITLHQRKYDKLVSVKKALLDKMFPETGNDVPKIRFKGFNDAWEQCEVGKIFKVTRGYVLPVSATSPQKTENTPYPVYSSQTQNNGLMGYYKDYLFDTAITWTTDGANAGTVSFRGEKFYSTNVNGVLLSDKGYANKCVAEALNLLAWRHVSHVGNPKLMNNVMSEIDIIIPPTISEQESISQLLTKLDVIITLHQRKHEKLQNIKKALLSKMFA